MWCIEVFMARCFDLVVKFICDEVAWCFCAESESVYCFGAVDLSTVPEDDLIGGLEDAGMA